jgi:hypothetical protein
MATESTMWIESIAPTAATGELKELYDRIDGARGGVAQIHQAQSLSPKVLATHFELPRPVSLAQHRHSHRRSSTGPHGSHGDLRPHLPTTSQCCVLLV